MKRSILCLLLTITGIFALSLCSCKKENAEPAQEEILEEDPVEEVEPNTMTARVNGEDWEASSILVTMTNEVTNITGVAADGREIAITIQADQQGAYTLNLVSSHVAVYTPDRNSDTVYSSNGDNTAGGDVLFEMINKSSRIMSGTFSFDAVQPQGQEKITISDGIFTKVKIQ